jgi:hypothetical protein
MAAAVWTLYAADRLLDTQSPDDVALEERHHFHHQHRKFFLGGIAVAAIILAALLPRLSQDAIHLYLILGVLVFGYFVVIHATQRSRANPFYEEHCSRRLSCLLHSAASTASSSMHGNILRVVAPRPTSSQHSR